MIDKIRSQISWWLLIIMTMLIVAIGGALNKASQSDKMTMNALEEAKQWQQIVQDCNTIAFIVINNKREIIQWSSGAELLFGWTETEAIDARIELIIPEEYMKRILNEENLKTATSKMIEINGYMQHKNGKLLHTNIQLIAIIDNQILYIIQVIKVEKVENLSKIFEVTPKQFNPPNKIEKFKVKK